MLLRPMANILYGVNGEGAGHSTRAKEVLTHLQEHGHTLHVASEDRNPAYWFSFASARLLKYTSRS
jgi:hypothetical protein